MAQRKHPIILALCCCCSIVHLKKWRSGEMEWLARGHRARKWPNCDLSVGPPDSRPLFFAGWQLGTAERETEEASIAVSEYEQRWVEAAAWIGQAWGREAARRTRCVLSPNKQGVDGDRGHPPLLPDVGTDATMGWPRPQAWLFYPEPSQQW